MKRVSNTRGLGRFGSLVYPVYMAMTVVSACAERPPVRPDAVIANEFVANFFDRFPEIAALQGLPDADRRRFRDNSPLAVESWEALLDGWANEIASIDPVRSGSPNDAALASLLREVIESTRGLTACRFELWNVSPTFTGWQSWMSLVMDLQPVGDDAARTDALTRLGQIDDYLETEERNLRRGLELGYSAPRTNVESVIDQLDAVLDLAPAESPFHAPVARDSSRAFEQAVSAVIANEAHPAIARHREFLATEYLPSARDAVGVSANPDGSICYLASLRFYTSLEGLEPDDLHELGRRELTSIELRIATIGERALGTDDVSEVLDRLRSDPEYLFDSREAIVSFAEQAVERARRALPPWFARIPEAQVIVRPFPRFRERAAPAGQYIAAADDGSRPATYLINTHQPRTQSIAALESTAFHETYPGHHLQIAIAKERPDAHPMTRYFGPSGFSEGWGLYAEHLAEEMGLFTSDATLIGMLSNHAWRAARLVVDTGIHARGWSREEAIEFLLSHTTLSRAAATAEIDRYIAVPGQATAYMLGYLEIRELRAMAERELGGSFDIGGFHDRVLRNGRVPLPFLRSEIASWVDERAAMR